MRAGLGVMLSSMAGGGAAHEAAKVLRAVALDLDGTLLRSDGSVSEGTVQALRRFVDCGGRAFVATGRGRAKAIGIAADLEARGLVFSDVICSDGCVAYGRTGDGRWEDVVFDRVAPGSEIAATLSSVAVASPGVSFGVEVNSDDGVLISDQRYIDVIRRHNPSVFAKVLRGRSASSDFWTALAASERVNWVRIIAGDDTEGDLLATVRRVAPEQFSCEASTLRLPDGPSAVVVKVRTTKALALERVAERWGLGASEICAFGDADNDLEMLEWCGQSCCPSNAWPLAKDRATYTSDLSNDEDFIVDALGRLDFLRPAGNVAE